MVQELYDYGTLHRMLGVTPKASIGQQNPQVHGSTKQSSVAERESVASAWGEASMDLGSSDEEDQPAERESDVEESRYGLGKRQTHPSKRRRVGNARDSHTVYTTDDDEDWENADRDNRPSATKEGESGRNGRVSGKSNRLQAHLNVYDDGEDDNLSEEDAEYNLLDTDVKDNSSRNGSSKPSLHANSRRSYWLSKAIGSEG